MDYSQLIEYGVMLLVLLFTQYLSHKYQSAESSNFITFIIQSLLVVKELDETELGNGERYVLAVGKISESLAQMGIRLDDDEIGEVVNNIVKLLRKAQETKY